MSRPGAAPAVLPLLGAPVASPPAPAPSAPTVDDSRSLLARVDAGLQDAALCEIAKRGVRDEWARKKDEITDSLRRSLGDEEEQERNLERETDKHAGLLGLDDAEREVFAERNRELRLGALERINALVRQEPPDYPGVHREIQEWIAAEDRMVKELFGAAARERLRADQLEGRSLILAIAVSLAGLEWSAATGW